PISAARRRAAVDFATQALAANMPVLKVTDLKKSFVSPDGERTMVVDVPDFELADGQHMALQGSSGSGKTTFLNLIAGILQADSGQIVFGGAGTMPTSSGGIASGNSNIPRDMASMPEADRDRLRATTIGYVFQTFNLLQGYTALENVMLGMMFGRGADRN